MFPLLVPKMARSDVFSPFSYQVVPKVRRRGEVQGREGPIRSSRTKSTREGWGAGQVYKRPVVTSESLFVDTSTWKDLFCCCNWTRWICPLDFKLCPLNFKLCPLNFKICPLNFKLCPLDFKICPLDFKICPLDFKICPLKMSYHLVPYGNVVPPQTIWTPRTTSYQSVLIRAIRKELVPIGSYQSHKKRTRTRFL